jgi:polysaccharide biosynthesis transport protein
MYMTPVTPPGPPNPITSQYPLRPASRISPVRINVIKSLRMHPVTAILVALLTLGFGLAVVIRHKPNYVATSDIYVSPTIPKTLIADSELDRPYENQIQETIHGIDRYDILADALHAMNPQVAQSFGPTERMQVESLRHSLDISRLGGTYQVEISMMGWQPEHLAEVVNAITKAYLDKAKGEEFYGRDQRLAALKDEATRIQTDIDSRLQEQAKISKDLGIAAVDGKQTSVFDDQNAKRREDLTVAHEEHIEAQAQLDALKNSDPSAPNSALNAAADEAIASDPGLVALKTSFSAKRSALLEQLAGLTPANPIRKQTEQQLAQIDNALQEMQNDLRKKAAARMEQKLRAKLNQTAMIESRLLNDLQSGNGQAAAAAPKFQRAESLQTEIDRLQARYTEVDERISNFELESSSPGSVHLFAPAMTPIEPEKSKMNTLLIGIFPVSIIFGILAAVLLDLLDPHIYTGTDLEAVLGFAPIGMLFDDKEVTQVVFDQCALRLAAGVDHASRAGNTRTFVVTSVNSGAGTTTVVENLGSMLAKLGRKTLVIDSSGLTEPVAYVTLGASLEKRAVDISDRNGRKVGPIGPIGAIQQAPPSPLAARVSPFSGFVFQGFQAITSEYDIVLIDAAPILISAETEYLARMADVTILLAEAGKTKKGGLTRAARLLERLGVAGAAAVVNKVNPARAEDSLKHDLREFELRSDRLNLQEWWRPGKKSTRPAAATPFQPGAEDRQEEVYAKDA